MDHSAYRHRDSVFIRDRIASFDAAAAFRAHCVDSAASWRAIACRIVDAAMADELEHLEVDAVGHSETTIEQQLPIAHRCSS